MKRKALSATPATPPNRHTALPPAHEERPAATLVAVPHVSPLSVLPDNLPRPARTALILQQSSPVTASPVTAAMSSAVAAYLPDGIPCPIVAAPREDCRAWLADVAPVPQLSPRSGGAERQASVNLGAPPDGLTGLECLLWPEMGRACARAVAFLYFFLMTRRYMDSCNLSGAATTDIHAYRVASPTYGALYTLVETAVRASRLARTEDTLHALANGDIRKVKTEQDAEGQVVKTVDEGAIYDSKALALALAAEDKARYGNGGGVPGGVVVNITLDGLKQADPLDAIEVAQLASDEMEAITT